jgi:nucleoside-triphosphatase
MALNPQKILITGIPGCGKTTAVMQIIEQLDPLMIAGFYTQEIRNKGIRKGFRWISLDGSDGILAHVDNIGRCKVGKYSVDVSGFEKSIVPMLNPEQPEIKLFVIDEIGKMECLSQQFKSAVLQLLTSQKSILATIAKKGTGLIAEAKKCPGIKFFDLTRENYDQTVTDILKRFSSLSKSK